jgi:hypothetical protein
MKQKKISERIESLYDGKSYNILDYYFTYTKYPMKYIHSSRYTDFVYVIKNESSGLYKIGITNDYQKRFGILQTQSGCYLKTIIVLELGDQDESAEHIEGIMHKYFKSKQILGEWHKLTKFDLHEIRILFYQIEGIYIFEEDNLPTWNKYGVGLVCVG